ncbi:MAG: GAF domain-containing protein [Magnetococcales bacterium]|nr:GAF domain-containing protein [Magnetococcales bacterium]
MLYQHLVDSEQMRLSAMASSQVRFINTLYEATLLDPTVPKSSDKDKIVALLTNAYQDWYKGLGNTGEILFAHRQEKQIEFLFRQRYVDNTTKFPKNIPWQDGDAAIPMRRALEKKSGVVIGPDYRGVEVLAAYEYIDPLDLGMVIKIDMAELRAPVTEAIAKTILLTLLLLGVGGTVFIRIGDVVIRRLHESRLTLKTMFEAASEGIVLLDPGAGSLHMANTRFCQMLGYKQEEIEGITLRDINADESLLSGLDACKDQKEVHSLNRNDIVLLCRDGNTLYVDVTLSSMVLHGQTHFLLMLRDATERRKILSARFINEERMQRMMEINRCAMDLGMQELCDRSLAVAESITGSRIGFLHLLNDELDSLSLISWSDHVSQSCNLQQTSHSCLDRTGVWADVVRQLQPVVCNDYQKLESRRGMPEGHVPITRFLSVPVLSRNTVKMVLVVGNKQEPYTEDDVRQLQLVGDDVMNLITRKRLEETLRQSKEQAEAASHAKASFLASMSHEIRTPMNGVLGMADLILRTSLTEQQRHYVNTIHRSGRTLLRIINDILDLSKIQAGRLVLELFRFDLDELIQDVRSMFTSQAHGKGLTFVCKIAEGVPVHLLGDPYRLNQVLFNLMGNAIKFTENGSVTLGVEVLEERAADVLLRFQVIDTGIGIAPEYLPNLFQPFSQADSSIARKFGGSGLGLAITRQLVLVMDGELWVESHPGHGAKFSFTVRFGKQQPGDRKVLADWEENQHPCQLEDTRFDGHILLVEDNLINQEVAEATLGLFGLRVTVARNGQQALITIQNAATPFDAIFMDCEMPILDGFETTRQVRAWEKQHGLPRIPIIALTAHVLKESRRLSREAGMDDYLHKPFSQMDLIKVLHRWLPANSGSGHEMHTDPQYKRAVRLEDRKIILPAESAPASSPVSSPLIETGVPTFPVLDPAALDQIVILAQNSRSDLLGRMVEHYCVQTPALLAELKQALAQQDSEGVRMAAHTLKSSSLTMGAARLAELGRILECHHADFILVETYLQSGGPEFEEVKQAMHGFLLEKAKN